MLEAIQGIHVQIGTMGEKLHSIDGRLIRVEEQAKSATAAAEAAAASQRHNHTNLSMALTALASKESVDHLDEKVSSLATKESVKIIEERVEKVEDTQEWVGRKIVGLVIAAVVTGGTASAALAALLRSGSH
jgi:glycine cleavage system pyridoxal-binding protein P